MGLFDKILKGGKAAPAIPTEPNTVYTPIIGSVIPLKDIPDPVFSEGVLGQGCGIEPAVPMVYAPFNGTISQVADTKHAVGITSDDGIEMLIHVGIDTVDMNGKGFVPKVKEGQKVQCGQELLAFDLSAIAAAGHLAVTAVLVTNSDDYSGLELLKTGPAEKAEKLLTVKQ